jgi:ubiquinone biosynthesis protein COQ4
MPSHLRISGFQRLPSELSLLHGVAAKSRSFSVLNRPPPNYEGHVPLTRIEQAGLAVGSAVISLLNPRRGGLRTIVHFHQAINC